MLTRWMFVAVVVTTLVLGACADARAYDAPSSRRTMKSLKEMSVVVEDISPQVQNLGLSKTQLQTDTELNLRKAGIRVSSEASAFLHVEVTCMNRPPIELYGCSLHVELDQAVTLVRDPSVQARATTWSVGQIYTVGKAYLSADVRAAVTDMVNIFINAYLEQNPRQ